MCGELNPKEEYHDPKVMGLTKRMYDAINEGKYTYEDIMVAIANLIANILHSMYKDCVGMRGDEDECFQITMTVLSSTCNIVRKALYEHI